ncbi:MAG: hypothetical protein ACFBSE_03600 [Prochloraceae cyanobacterium]
MNLNVLLLLESNPLPLPVPPVSIPTSPGGGQLPPPPNVEIDAGSGTTTNPVIENVSEIYSQIANGILQKSADLTQNTAESWEKVWNYAIFDPTHNYLWDSLVDLGLKLALLSVLWMAFTQGTTFIKKQDYSSIVQFTIWPIVISYLLSNNGAMLARTIEVSNAIALSETAQVYEAQILGVSLYQSLMVTRATSLGIDAIEGVFEKCQGKAQQQLADCLKEQGTTAREIIDFLDREVMNNGTSVLAGLRKKYGSIVMWTQDLSSSRPSGISPTTGDLFGTAFARSVKTILHLIQWGFVNTLQIALLFSALVSPLALGLSLMPIQGRPIIGWLIGYFGLWGIQIGYSMIVGLMAWVVVNSQLEAIADLAFLAYLAIFAPSLATGAMTFSGMAIHQGVMNNIDEIKDVISDVISFGTGVTLKVAQIK